MAHFFAAFHAKQTGLQGMDLDSAEESQIVRHGFGLALLVFCLMIALHNAQERALAKVDASMKRAFLVVDEVDAIVDALDRLSLNQRFFLYARDVHFSQDAYESLMVVQIRMDTLRRVAKRDVRLRNSIAELDQAIDRELAILRNASEIDKSKGHAEAIALLNKEEPIEEARTNAEHIRVLAIENAFDWTHTEGKIKSMLDVFL